MMPIPVSSLATVVPQMNHFFTLWILLAFLTGAVLTAALILVLTGRRKHQTSAAFSDELRNLIRAIRSLSPTEARSRTDRHLVGNGQLDSVAALIGEVSSEVRHRIEDERHQREALEAVLTSMAQGVVAIDLNQRLLSINPAAATLLNVDPIWARGRPLIEVVRNEVLQRTITEALKSDQLTECEIVLPPTSLASANRREEERRIIVRGKGMHDADDRRIGAIMAFHDISRLRRLEKIRQDFVANVSHELRTPITTIKGCIETLLDGSDHDSETADRFLRMIERQAQRLHSTLEDVLTLASLESDPERREPETDRVNVADLLRAAVDCCRMLALERSIRIDFECAPDLYAFLNGALIEQALVNLIENAIKYSPEQSAILVKAEILSKPSVHKTHQPANTEHLNAPTLETPVLILSVRDNGIGISRDHHGRIFERFYRVDKGRSRTVGGTGLGLSIVKHIAQAHDGEVRLESAPGKGSTFSIIIPVN